MEFIFGDASVKIDYNKDDHSWGIVLSSSSENSEVSVTGKTIYQIRAIFLAYVMGQFNMITNEVYKSKMGNFNSFCDLMNLVWNDELKDQIDSEILAWVNSVSAIKSDKKEGS